MEGFLHGSKQLAVSGLEIVGHHVGSFAFREQGFVGALLLLAFLDVATAALDDDVFKDAVYA